MEIPSTPAEVAADMINAAKANIAKAIEGYGDSIQPEELLMVASMQSEVAYAAATLDISVRLRSLELLPMVLGSLPEKTFDAIRKYNQEQESKRT